MKAALSLEHFETRGRFAGYLGRDKSKPWVARLTGLDDHYGFARQFVRAYGDYSKSSGTGARGIWLHYALDDGIYEVNERMSWHHVRRYFVRVSHATVTEIPRSEVLACLSATSVSTFLKPLSGASRGFSIRSLASIVRSLAAKIRRLCCT